MDTIKTTTINVAIPFEGDITHSEFNRCFHNNTITIRTPAGQIHHVKFIDSCGLEESISQCVICCVPWLCCIIAECSTFHCRNLCRSVKHTRQTLHVDSAAKFLEVKYLGNGVEVVVRNAHTEYEFTNYKIFPKKEQMC